MPGVDVQGPDGKDYQFPDGTTKEAAIAYFKKKGIGVQAPAAQTPTAPAPYKGLDYSTRLPEAQRPFLERMFSPENIARASEPPANAPWYSPERAGAAAVRTLTAPISLLRGPTTEEEAGLEFSGGYQSLLAQRLMNPTLATAGKTKESAQQVMSALRSPSGGDPMTPALKTLGYGAATAIPVIGPAMAGTYERLPHDPLGAVSELAMGAELAHATGEAKVPGSVENVFQRNLAATSHDILNKSSTQIKGKLWDAHNAVSQRVGQLVNDISAADYAKGEASIPVADLWEKVKDTADQYKAGGKDTPKFNAAQAAVLDRGPYLTWKELHDLKQEVGSQWYKAAEGSRDAGAVNALLEDINKKLAQRASEVDRADQFKAYNSLWSTLKNYESDGVMGKLQNAPNGKAFMDILKDPANKADVTRTINSLSNFGFPKDALSTFEDTHSTLHQYVTPRKGIGKAAIIKQHPVIGGAGLVAGGAAGSLVGQPWLGAIAGGATATALADRIAAARAVSRLGVPSLEGEMETAAKVKPVGTGERPTPPPSTSTVNRSELTQAMQSLGYSKQEAATRAMQGIAEHPNDFSAALNRAMRGPASAEKAATIKSVSGGSQGVERGTYSADPRTHEQILEGLQALRESQKKNATIESRATEAMAPKSIKSHNDAFQAAKQEWQAANPGKDPASHMSEIARRAENLRKGK